MVKCLSTMWETWVQSLGWEDLLEKETATHSSILAWEVPWTEEPGRLQSMGLQSQTGLSHFTFNLPWMTRWGEAPGSECTKPWGESGGQIALPGQTVLSRQ